MKRKFIQALAVGMVMFTSIFMKTDIYASSEHIITLKGDNAEIDKKETD